MPPADILMLSALAAVMLSVADIETLSCAPTNSSPFVRNAISAPLLATIEPGS